MTSSLPSLTLIGVIFRSHVVSATFRCLNWLFWRQYLCVTEKRSCFWWDKLPGSFFSCVSIFSALSSSSPHAQLLINPHTNAAIPSFPSLSPNISTAVRSWDKFYCYTRNASSIFTIRLLQMPHGLKAIILNYQRAGL